MIVGSMTLVLALYLSKAIYSDVTRRTIKNQNVLAIFCCCMFLNIGTNNYDAIIYSFGVLIFGSIIFFIGVCGAGDVKLMAAVSIAVPVAKQVDFIAYTLMIGGILAVMIIIMSKIFKRPDWKRLGVPYAIPISLSGFYYIAHSLMSL
jgi:prepilin peptidase CpaA